MVYDIRYGIVVLFVDVIMLDKKIYCVSNSDFLH